MDKVELRERRFVHAVRTVLNESAGQLPSDVRDRLAAARRMALAQEKAEALSTVHSPALTMSGGGPISLEMEGEALSPLQHTATVLRRLDLLWPTIALMAGLVGVYRWQQQ